MRKYFIYLLALFAITACSDYDEYGHNATQKGSFKFGTSADLLKLQDDSTSIAGTLEITANSPSVELKWNVPLNCNLDTTVTELKLENGKAQLPIKWASQLKDGNYGPMTSAYSAGVLITAGNNKKYVPLIWADEVDTVKVMEYIQINTRAGQVAMPTAEELFKFHSPNPLSLHVDTCGDIRIEHRGRCYVDYSGFEEDSDYDKYHLDLSGIASQYFEGITTLPVRWTQEGASELEFMGYIKLFTNMGITKFAYIQYTKPVPKQWEFIKCIPDSLSILPAKGAIIVAVAETNCAWSVKYYNDDGDDIEADNPAGELREQSLSLIIPDNNNLERRNIHVDVFKEGALERRLRYTQSGSEGIFAIKSVSPAVGTHLKVAKDTVKVQVETSRNWWIRLGGTKYDILANNSEGKIAIPENTSSSTREIVVTVGYDDTLVETYVYTQDFGSELVYDRWDETDEIPVDGGTYAFHFSGSYVGNLQIRALVGDKVIVTGPVTPGKDPTITIPNNYMSIETRYWTFEYNGPDGWKKIEGVTVKQLGATITYEILPTTAIPREGNITSGIFSGTYRGTIKMKAESGDELLKENNGNCPGTISLEIPAMADTATVDRTVKFSYSYDGGNTWVYMGTRTQLVGSLTVGTIMPDDVTIPAGGKEYDCSFTGTYSGNIIFRARVGDRELVRETGKAPVLIKLLIPKNEDNEKRTVVFEYSKDNGKTWTYIDDKDQTFDIKIDSGDNNVGDFEDKGDITGGIGGDI